MAIQFSSGIKEHQLALYEGQTPVVVRFNPTNMIFAEGVFNAMEDIDGLVEAYNRRFDEITPDDGAKELFELTRQAEREIREKLNNTFHTDICTPLFGEFESVYAAGDGLPVWANILLSVIDEMDVSFIEEKKKTNPRIKKYIEKYSGRGK